MTALAVACNLLLTPVQFIMMPVFMRPFEGCDAASLLVRVKVYICIFVCVCLWTMWP